MSFNRRGPDRRPDRPSRDRTDRPPRRAGDWQPREAGDRSYPPRDRGGERPYPGGGGGRPYSPRPRFDRPPDDGAMSIRLDPRRVGTLKQLAGDAGMRPGDLVRQWIEERLDAARGGAATEASSTVLTQLADLAERVAALEAGVSHTADRTPTAVEAPSEPTAVETPSAPAAGKKATRPPRNTVSAAPPTERVALHDEMIALLRERGPMTAAELADAIAERGRYAPPRSGKPLDAAMVSQRVSNPTYRARFVRSEGRIALAE